MTRTEHVHIILRSLMRKAALLTATFVGVLLAAASGGMDSPAIGNTWSIRPIDNMHASRDFVCWQQSASSIDAMAASAAAANANFGTVDAEKNIIDLDPERKAAMVSNLLVVLCGHVVPQPVLNAGTLHN